MLAPLVRDMIAAELPVLEANGLSMWGYSVLVALDRSAIRTQAALADAIGADKTRIIAILDELQDKGLIASWLSNPTPERGGRSKRHYRLEKSGERALQDSVVAARRICDAVENAWGKWKPVRQS